MRSPLSAKAKIRVRGFPVFEQIDIIPSAVQQPLKIQARTPPHISRERNFVERISMTYDVTEAALTRSRTVMLENLRLHRKACPSRWPTSYTITDIAEHKVRRPMQFAQRELVKEPPRAG